MQKVSNLQLVNTFGTMVSSSKSPLLFVCTLSLWMVQLSMPVFEKSLPSLSFTRNSVEFTIPLTQILNFFVGGVCFILAYCLLASRSGGRLSLAENLLYLTTGFMITTGHGIHTVCVLLGARISHLPEVDALVDFLHEVVSHNMFVGSFFLLMVQVMAVEKAQFLYMLDLEKKAVAYEPPKNVNATSNNSVNGHVPNGKVHIMEVTKSSLTATIKRAMLHWLFPAIVGAYFSIFSTMTGTEAVTVLFYIVVYMYLFDTYQELGLQRLLTAMDADLQVFGSTVKAACIGLPVLVMKLRIDNIMS